MVDHGGLVAVAAASIQKQVDKDYQFAQSLEPNNWSTPYAGQAVSSLSQNDKELVSKMQAMPSPSQKQAAAKTTEPIVPPSEQRCWTEERLQDATRSTR